MEALAGRARTEDGQPDGDGRRGGRGRSGAGQDKAARPPRAMRLSFRAHARSQRRRRLDFGGDASRERDCALLLGKPVGKLRRRGDSCLERSATLGASDPSASAASSIS